MVWKRWEDENWMRIFGSLPSVAETAAIYNTIQYTSFMPQHHLYITMPRCAQPLLPFHAHNIKMQANHTLTAISQKVRA